MRILNEIGITLNNYSIGNHKTFCPKCKHTRKSQNRFDTPLSVTIDSEKVLYKCQRYYDTNTGQLWGGIAATSNTVSSFEFKFMSLKYVSRSPIKK